MTTCYELYRVTLTHRDAEAEAKWEKEAEEKGDDWPVDPPPHVIVTRLLAIRSGADSPGDAFRWIGDLACHSWVSHNENDWGDDIGGYEVVIRSIELVDECLVVEGL